MQPPIPAPEHKLLQTLLGSWTCEMVCKGPDGADAPPVTGRAVARAIGPVWIVMEMSGGEANDQWSSLLTLGFDPDKGRFVGTFIASMMTWLWVYDGQLDAGTNTIQLDTQGPRFDGQPGQQAYVDHYQIVDRDTWILRSFTRTTDGLSAPFMTATYRRA